MENLLSYVFDAKEGYFHLILGPMFSGKTKQLFNFYNRSKYMKKKSVIVKYKLDDRYDDIKASTHDQLKMDCLNCHNLNELDDILKNYDIIFIDEIQFYDDAVVMIKKWTNEKKKIFACGLNGNWKQEPFTVISNLLPLVDSLIHLTAVCEETGNNAPFTTKKINNNKDIEIGGAELYVPIDRTMLNNYK